MGKSNKFDFSNRPSSGAKLGKSISQALQREAQRIRRDGESLAARSQMDGSRSSPDLEVSAHSIDFQAHAKSLGDEGWAMVADGLSLALNEQSPFVRVEVEELNLAENEISSKSLASLARVVAFASQSIQAINLASNRICILTDDEANAFEDFFRACCFCVKLQTLNLSGNPLGRRAFQRLAKIHQDLSNNSQKYTASRRSINLENLSLSSVEDTSSSSSGDSMLFDRWSSPSNEIAPKFVPQINFQNTELADDGALWLSYIVADFLDAPLIYCSGEDEFSSKQSVHGITKDNPSGIDWSENTSTLSKDGQALLRKAEAVRGASLVLIQQQSEESSDEEVEQQSNLQHSNSDLESIRKKVQRLVLEQHDYHEVDLWHASLFVFWTARKVRYLASKGFLAKVGYEGLLTTILGGLGCTQNLSCATHESAVDVVSNETTVKKTVYASLRIINTSPSNGGGKKDALQSNGRNGKMKNRRSVTDKQSPTKANGQNKIANDRHELMTILRSIVAYLLPATHLSILSANQLERAMAWGLSKKTLAVEHQWNRHSDSLKIWMLLDSIHGLAYECDEET